MYAYFFDYDYARLVFCKGRCVGTNRPCGKTRDLDAQGYCKYHAPNAPQCKAMAATTGERCRFRWDLNANQLCKYHAWQGSTSSGDVEVTKVAKAALGKRETPYTAKCAAAPAAKRCRVECDIRDERLRDDYAGAPLKEDVIDVNAQKAEEEENGDDAVGPEDDDRGEETKLAGSKVEKVKLAVAMRRAWQAGTFQCRGDAATTGMRCRIRWDLNEDLLCEYHWRQVVKCHGVVKATGRRCWSSVSVDEYGFCPLHSLSCDLQGDELFNEAHDDPAFENEDEEEEEEVQDDQEENGESEHHHQKPSMPLIGPIKNEDIKTEGSECGKHDPGAISPTGAPTADDAVVVKEEKREL